MSSDRTGVNVASPGGLGTIPTIVARTLLKVAKNPSERSGDYEFGAVEGYGRG